MKESSFDNFKRPEESYKVSEDVAWDQLAPWLHSYEIYLDEITVENEKNLVRHAMNKLLIAVRCGKVTLKEDGSFTQHLKNEDDLEYKALTGSAKTQNKEKSDRAMDAMATSRQHATMGSLCNLGAMEMGRLHHNDMSVMETIGFLLSAV